MRELREEEERRRQEHELRRQEEEIRRRQEEEIRRQQELQRQAEEERKRKEQEELERKRLDEIRRRQVRTWSCFPLGVGAYGSVNDCLLCRPGRKRARTITIKIQPDGRCRWLFKIIISPFLQIDYI